MSSRPRAIGIGAVNGLGIIRSAKPINLGDVLSDAQAKLLAAGYEGVTCRTERVYFPGVDASGKSFYEQNVCSAPGYIGAFDADVVSQQSTAAHAGTGVDLNAERVYLNAHGDGPGTGSSYFDDFSGPLTQVIALTSPTGAVSTVPAPQSAPDFKAWTRQADATAATRNTAGASGAGAATTAAAQTGASSAGASNTNTAGVIEPAFDLGKIFGDINPLYLIGGAAVIAYFLFMKK